MKNDGSSSGSRRRGCVAACSKVHESRMMRNMAGQIIASIILFQSWTIVAAEEAAIPSDLL